MSAYENWKVELALAGQPDAAIPVWDTDITGYVSGPVRIGQGRQSEFTTVQPATLSLVLDNADHRFTPGNTSSPYYPNFKQARRVRVRETIGNRTFDLFSGYLELPDISDWAQQGTAQTITVTAVDRLTRLDRARKFVSTLSEHVVYNGGSTLKGYWMCTEAATPFASSVNPALHPPLRAVYGSGALATSSGTAQVLPQQGTMPPGEDLKPVRLTVATDSDGFTAQWYELTADYTEAPSRYGNLTLSAGQVLTAVVWINPDETGGDIQPAALQIAYDESGPTGSGFLTLYTGTNATWRADVNGTAFSGNIAGSGFGVGLTKGQPYPVAIRYGYSPQVFELWVGKNVTTGTLTGSAPTTTTITSISSASTFQGTWGHAQIYVGAATDWTSTHLSAQIDMAWQGLAWQTPAQRIRTIAQYASMPAGELSLDDGTTNLAKASLTGKTPLAAMREAEVTEQGVLYADGAGRLVFQDRRVRYNV